MKTRLWTMLARRRPMLSVEVLVFLASLVFATAYNNALWKLLFGDADFGDLHTWLLFGALFGIVVCVQFSGLALVLTRRTVRPVLAILFIATAFACYYMDRYTVFLNQEMLRNIFATDPAEAGELLTTELFFHLLLHAVLPVMLLAWVRVTPRAPGFRSWRRAVLRRLAAVAGAMLVAAVLLLTQYRAEMSLLRPHREARHLVTPTNYLAALYKLGRNKLSDSEGPRVAIGLDAHRLVPASEEKRPVLLVLVVGESVRSANFGLSGYSRNTTPELRKMDVLVYPRVESCGTSTEVSLPCMFSALGQRNYDIDRIEHQQSLLNLLDGVGYPTVWIDNQSGCKGVCTGLPEIRIPGDADPTFCNGERCLDGILESRLAGVVKDNKGDLVVVLHMLGNHGPAYWRRYPPAFRRFVPDCESLEVSECSSTEIVNAYDNAILYTDHVLAGLIRYLETLDARDTALLYISDHGESLGESGIYLHGLPRSIAPAVQHQVPMVAWLSAAFERSSRLDERCLKQGTGAELSHDNLFSSILGLLQVDTRLRDPALDIFSRCRTGPAG